MPELHQQFSKNDTLAIRPLNGVRWCLVKLCLVLLVGGTSQVNLAQTYPRKPIRLLVPGASGGSDDIHVRIVTPALAEKLGQNFVVENRPHAGGLVAQKIVIDGMPDGHTLLLTGRSIFASRYLNAGVNFDPERALAPVAQLVTYPFVLVVHPSVPARTVADLVSVARAQPGHLTIGEMHGGLMPTVASILFRGMTRINMRTIGYKDGGQLYIELVAGHINVFFASIANANPYITQGRLRALGVTGKERSDVLPNIPTVSEAGVEGYDASSWLFIAAPAGTPRNVVGTLNKAVAEALTRGDVAKRLRDIGSTPSPATPEQLAKRNADAARQFRELARELGIKPQ